MLNVYTHTYNAHTHTHTYTHIHTHIRIHIHTWWDLYNENVYTIYKISMNMPQNSYYKYTAMYFDILIIKFAKLYLLYLDYISIIFDYILE